jgi:hypothetical protein
VNSWFAKHIGDGMWAPMVCAEIEEKFQPLFESAGKPIEMAIFVRREEGDVHCEVIAYFSPEAGNVAEVFDAETCAKPSREGLELLAGDESCWSALF